MKNRGYLQLLFYLFSAYSNCMSETPQSVPGKTAQERSLALFTMIDTSSVVRSSPESLEKFLTSVKNQAESEHDQALLKLTAYFREVGPALFDNDATRRIQIYEKACQRFGKERNDRLRSICLQCIAQENFVLGNYGVAFDKSLQSLDILEEIGFQRIPEIGKYLHDIALNYYYFRDYQTVIELMHKALQHPAYTPNLDIQRYNTLALSYRQKGKADSAVYYFQKAAMRAESYGDSTWITLIAGNLGAVYINQKEYQAALPLLLRDYRYNRKDEESPEMARNAALSLAGVWLELNRPDSAAYYLKESQKLHHRRPLRESFGQQQQDEDFRKSYYEVLAHYYKRSGSYMLAYQYLDSLNQTTRELDRRYNTMLATVAEDKLKMQQYVSDIEIERQKRQTASARWTLGVALLLLCFLLLGLVYYLNRARHAKQKALAALKAAEAETKQKLTIAEFERAKDQLRHQLELLKEKNLLIEGLRHELETAGEEREPPSNALEKLAGARLLTQEDWVAFRLRFNQVFGNSLDELKKKYPDITQSEERIYALIQLDIGTRQMASMLGISPESVRKARYRLNKRLKSA